MHIATLGCSHSSYFAGTPWPVYLAESLDSELTMAHSSGAGNEMNIEKLRLLLAAKPNLVIVQLTDPSRLVLGMDRLYCESQAQQGSLTSPHRAGNLLYYTVNPRSNIDNLQRLTGQRYHPDLDLFLQRHVLLSEHNLSVKICHTVATMQYMCNRADIPVIFFSWCEDLDPLFRSQGWYDTLSDCEFIPGCVEQFARDQGLEPIPGNGHYDSPAHEIIARLYILAYIRRRNLINI